jgi:hypothetical protein
VRATAGIPLRRFLSLQNVSTTGIPSERLGRQGVVAEFVVRSRGGGAFNVVAVVQKGAQNVSTPLIGAVNVAPSAGSTRQKLWLPAPPEAGRYRVAVLIFRLGSSPPKGARNESPATGTATRARSRTDATPSAAGASSRVAAALASVPLDSERSKPFALGASTIRFYVGVQPTGAGAVVLSRTRPKACARRRCAFSLPPGTRLTVVARPKSGWRFAGWRAPCGARRRCVVTVGPIRSVRALFRRRPPGSSSSGPLAARRPPPPPAAAQAAPPVVAPPPSGGCFPGVSC